jgi:hypothetical protein
VGVQFVTEQLTFTSEHSPMANLLLSVLGAFAEFLRVEQIQTGAPGRVYPRCTGGRRAGPSEEWDGPWAFVEQT